MDKLRRYGAQTLLAVMATFVTIVLAGTPTDAQSAGEAPHAAEGGLTTFERLILLATLPALGAGGRMAHERWRRSNGDRRERQTPSLLTPETVEYLVNIRVKIHDIRNELGPLYEDIQEIITERECKETVEEKARKALSRCSNIREAVDSMPRLKV